MLGGKRMRVFFVQQRPNSATAGKANRWGHRKMKLKQSSRCPHQPVLFLRFGLRCTKFSTALSNIKQKGYWLVRTKFLIGMISHAQCSYSRLSGSSCPHSHNADGRYFCVYHLIMMVRWLPSVCSPDWEPAHKPAGHHKAVWLWQFHHHRPLPRLQLVSSQEVHGGGWGMMINLYPCCCWFHLPIQFLSIPYVQCMFVHRLRKYHSRSSSLIRMQAACSWSVTVAVHSRCVCVCVFTPETVSYSNRLPKLSFKVYGDCVILRSEHMKK